MGLINFRSYTKWVVQHLENDSEWVDMAEYETEELARANVLSLMYRVVRRFFQIRDFND